MKHSPVLLLAFFTLGLSSCNDDTNSSFPTMEQYLERNNITDYNETASGLIYVINKEGTGDLPLSGQTLTVHYTGFHLDDSKFDSSYDRNEAFTFTLGEGRVITGWEEGFRFFKKGGSGTLYIPYELAYGESGFSSIGPKEDLKFDVNLIAID